MSKYTIKRAAAPVESVTVELTYQQFKDVCKALEGRWPNMFDPNEGWTAPGIFAKIEQEIEGE